MNFEPQIILLWGNLFLSLAAVAGHVKNWMSSGEKQLTKDVVALSEKAARVEQKLTDHDRRIQAIESELDYLPKQDAMHQLEINIEKLNSRIEVFAESLKPVRNNMELLNDLLREQVKK